MKVDEAKPSLARKDYRPLKSVLKADKLVRISIYPTLIRNYANYVPTSPPQSSFSANVKVIDLETNVYELYQDYSIANPVGGEWKEPPEYPGVTNMYFQSLEQLRSKVLGAFEPLGSEAKGQ